jgi:MFS family permease
MRESSSFVPWSFHGRWFIVILLACFAAIAQYNRYAIAVAGDEVFIPKMGISEISMGWVYSTFLIVYTICMMPGGWLIDRVGAGIALLLLGLSMGTFVVLTGCLGWLVTDADGLWVGLLVVRGIAGACSAPLHPAAAHTVAELMPRTGRAMANGMVTAGAVIGIAYSGPVFGWLIDRFTWQWAFVVSGVALLCYALFWRIAAAPLFSTEASARPTPDRTSTSSDTGVRAVLKLLSQRSLWLTTLSYAAYGYFQYLFFYWMGYYFKDVLGVPKEDARYCSVYVTLAMGRDVPGGCVRNDWSQAIGLP